MVTKDDMARSQGYLLTQEMFMFFTTFYIRPLDLSAAGLGEGGFFTS